jgi:hypothetical protein
MASNRLAVNAQLPGDVAVRPSTSRKCQNCLNFGHLELIRHSIVRSRREPEANDKGRISAFSKWPVLARPSVAGFARPMTPWLGRIQTASFFFRDLKGFGTGGDAFRLTGNHVLDVIGGRIGTLNETGTPFGMRELWDLASPESF